MGQSHQKHPPGSRDIGEYGTFGSFDRGEFEAAISEGMLTNALSIIMAKPRESFADVPLHIAIIGEPGSGKTSFINAMQNPLLGNSDAAATDIETRARALDSTNPAFHQVMFSEITWKGELHQAEDIHGKEADLNDFDFFFVIAPQSSQATHSRLMFEVQQMDKEFSMVQTKIDLDLEEAEKQQLSDYNEETFLLPVKDSCRGSLRDKGVKDPQVFAVSNMEPNSYDFPSLRETLTSDLLRKKKKACLSKIDTVCSPILEKKVDKLKGKIWLPIISSGFIAAMPVPGAAFLGGIVLFVMFGSWCCYKFGVDDRSLSKLAQYMKGVLSDLKSMMTSQSKKPVILQRLPDFLGASVMSVEYLYWEHFPIFGCILSGGISLVSSYFMLKKCISDVKKDTQNILSRAATTTLKNTNPESL